MEERQEDFQFEKIKEISKLMGSGTLDETNIMGMIETAKKIKTMMQFLNTQEETQPQSETENTAPKVTQKADLSTDVDKNNSFSFSNRQEKVIYAAIPFLDREYQKNLYVFVRLLEIRRILSQGELLESRSRIREEPSIRRKQLLQAVKPYLSPTEKRSIDSIVKAMDMKYILDRKEE